MNFYFVEKIIIKELCHSFSPCICQCILACVCWVPHAVTLIALCVLVCSNGCCEFPVELMCRNCAQRRKESPLLRVLWLVSWYCRLLCWCTGQQCRVPFLAFCSPVCFQIFRYDHHFYWWELPTHLQFWFWICRPIIFRCIEKKMNGFARQTRFECCLRIKVCKQPNRSFYQPIFVSCPYYVDNDST